MDITEHELLAKALANQPRIDASAPPHEEVLSDLFANAELVFGLYPDRSKRGFNYTVIKGAEHLLRARASRWDVVPFASADEMDAACVRFGDYDWLAD